jgi:hypothetical protein
MLRTFVDELMGTNVAIVLVVAHIAALAWAVLLRKGMTPALLLNLILSAVILAYNADHLLIMLQYADFTLLALMVYAAAVLACSAGALYGLRMPTWINWTAFAINFGLSILLLAFLATFKMTRLF